MNENTYDPSSGQGNFGKNSVTLQFDAPFDPAKIYTKSQLVSCFSISENTVTEWEKRGLQVYRPCCREGLYFGVDVAAFVRANPDFTATRKRRKKR